MRSKLNSFYPLTESVLENKDLNAAIKIIKSKKITMGKKTQEIEKYFNKNKDEDYLRFDGDELSSVENIMNPDKPAPWDHLSNYEDDEDIDVNISERKGK